MEFSTFLEIYGIKLTPCNSEIYLYILSSKKNFHRSIKLEEILINF